MSLTDVKERQMLQKWAAEHSDGEIFDKRCEADENSYFISRNREDTYILKYKFESIPQLQEKLEEVCGDGIDRQTQKLLAIAAFKCRTEHSEDMKEADVTSSVDRGKLPEFTYAF